MIIAVFLSLLMREWFGISWKGSRRNRFKMGLLGSSLYLLLSLVFLYQMFNLKPANPHDDTFMAFVGLLFGLIVSIVAFITFFCFTALSRRKQTYNQ